MIHSGLAATIQAMAKPKRAQATVTVAIFGGTELANADELNDAIKPILSDELGSRRSRRRPSPFVVSAKTDGALPLNLPAIIRAAGPHGKTIQRASYVAFVRYAGPPLAGNRHIVATLKAAAVLASSRSHILLDVSTRRVYDALKWAQWIDGDSTLADQVVPGAERTPGGVTFFSRGMAKFGLPDLEVFGVPLKEARTRFKEFQGSINALRRKGYVKVGGDLEGKRLLACQRSPQAIEAECVRLP